MTLLYELHDQARERGVEGYRKMSKAELEVALGLAEPPGPTAVESRGARRARRARAGGANDENALSLETLEALADAAERLAADEGVRMIAITGAGPRIFSSGADLNAVRGLPGSEVTAARHGGLRADRDAAGADDRAAQRACRGRRRSTWRWRATGGSPRRAPSCGSSTTSWATARRGAAHSGSAA